MKRILPLLLVLSVLLCACAGAPEPTVPMTEPTPAPTTEPTAAPTTEPVTEPATEPTTEPTEEPTTEPTEPPVLYRNPLTGEALEEPYVGRVFAVTINNVSPALPHHGVSQADVFFEMFINDYCTRGLALYSNIAEMESVGSIRSTRYNFTDLGQAFDLVLIHASASDVVLSDLRRSGVDNMCADGTFGYRDKDRRSAGYAWEHTLFVKGEAAIKAAKDKGINIEKEGLDYGLQFAEDATPAGGEAASEVKLVFTLKGHTKTSIMKYDAETGKYVYWQYGEEMIDENNDQPEAFENVIVILAPTHNEGVYHVAELDGSGDGYFACNGKIVPIKWIHEEETDPFTFTLADGTPLTLGVGSSYIAIAPTGSPVTYE